MTEKNSDTQNDADKQEATANSPEMRSIEVELAWEESYTNGIVIEIPEVVAKNLTKEEQAELVDRMIYKRMAKADRALSRKVYDNPHRYYSTSPEVVEVSAAGGEKTTNKNAEPEEGIGFGMVETHETLSELQKQAGSTTNSAKKQSGRKKVQS